MIELYLSDQVSEDDWLRWGRSATTAAACIYDMDCYERLSDLQLARVRTSGALTQLALSPNLQADLAALRGDLEAGAALVAELWSVREATGIRMGAHGGKIVAAYQGRTDELAALEREFAAPGDGFAVAAASVATAILSNGRGRYADALAAAQDVGQSYSFWQPQALVELVEAAIRTAQPDLAPEALAELAKVVVPGSSWIEGLYTRSPALVDDGARAEHSYRKAIALLTGTPLRIELGRAHLLYGEWLRRASRRADARTQLRSTYDLFTTTGAEMFAHRARDELQATGERVRKRALGTRHQLTPQRGAHRPPRPGRTVERRDRIRLLPQPTNRGMAPPQGLREAFDHQPQWTTRCTAPSAHS